MLYVKTLSIRILKLPVIIGLAITFKIATTSSKRRRSPTRISTKKSNRNLVNPNRQARILFKNSLQHFLILAQILIVLTSFHFRANDCQPDRAVEWGWCVVEIDMLALTFGTQLGTLFATSIEGTDMPFVENTLPRPKMSEDVIPFTEYRRTLSDCLERTKRHTFSPSAIRGCSSPTRTRSGTDRGWRGWNPRPTNVVRLGRTRTISDYFVTPME